MAFNTNEILAFTHSVMAAGEDTTHQHFTPPPSPASPLSGFPISPGAPADFYNLNYSLSGQNDDIVIRRPGHHGSANPNGGAALITGVLYFRDNITAMHTASAVHLEPTHNGNSTTITCKLPAIKSKAHMIATVDENNLTVYYQLSSAGAGTTTLEPVASGYKGTGPDMRRKKLLGYL
jgi:hypothetical protein